MRGDQYLCATTKVSLNKYAQNPNQNLLVTSSLKLKEGFPFPYEDVDEQRSVVSFRVITKFLELNFHMYVEYEIYPVNDRNLATLSKAPIKKHSDSYITVLLSTENGYCKFLVLYYY